MIPTILSTEPNITIAKYNIAKYTAENNEVMRAKWVRTLAQLKGENIFYPDVTLIHKHNA